MRVRDKEKYKKSGCNIICLIDVVTIEEKREKLRPLVSYFLKPINMSLYVKGDDSGTSPRLYWDMCIKLQVFLWICIREVCS